jgi:TRAP transporter TAXI family solute receptor
MKACKLIAVLGLTFGLVASAWSQTLGMAATNRGYTQQASAAIAKVVTEKTDLQMRVQAFGGTSVYVPLVSQGQMDFGLANEYETYMASTGTGIYADRQQSNLRIAAVLTPFRVAIFARADSDIHTLADLRGKRVPAGWTSQKIIGSLMNAVLANGGLSYDDVEQVPVANVPSAADDFATGKTDVFFFAFGAGKVQETAAKVGGIRVLPIDAADDAVARMREHVPPAYAYTVKPSRANVGVEQEMDVMAYDYLLLTNGNVADDVVYQIVKTMHDSPDELKQSFPGLGLFMPERMTKPFDSVEYHPGAIRFYQETGQWPAE